MKCELIFWASESTAGHFSPTSARLWKTFQHIDSSRRHRRMANSRFCFVGKKALVHMNNVKWVPIAISHCCWPRPHNAERNLHAYTHFAMHTNARCASTTYRGHGVYFNCSRYECTAVFVRNLCVCWIHMYAKAHTWNTYMWRAVIICNLHTFIQLPWDRWAFWTGFFCCFSFESTLTQKGNNNYENDQEWCKRFYKNMQELFQIKLIFSNVTICGHQRVGL